MLKLLIAESGEEFRDTLADRLRGRYRIRTCREGTEALEMMIAFKPDLAVLDMMLPGLDGISIIEEARRCGVRTRILAVTKFPSDYMVDSATRLEIAYMMVKPCLIKAVIQRLRDLEQTLEEPAAVRPDPKTAVINALLALGISTKLLGYTYLCEAILEYRERPGQAVTKILYPKVGKICNASSTQVERSIRSAICKAWKNRDDALWRSWFQSVPGEPLKRPSNAVFITAIANRLSLDDGIGPADGTRLHKLQRDAEEKL